MTHPFVPKDLLNRRSEPQKPVPLPGAGVPPIPDVAPIAPVPTINSINPSPTQNQINTAIQTEANDLNRVHQQLVSLLDPGSELSSLGRILSNVVSKLSPGGTVLMSPILQNFQQNAIATLTPAVDITSDSTTSDNLSTQLYSVIKDISTQVIPNLLEGLQTSVSIQQSQLDAHNQESLVRQDALRGYSTAIQVAAQSAELIATQGPKLWNDASNHPEIVAGDLSVFLSNASSVIYSTYEEAITSALSTHGIVRSSAEKQCKLAGNLQKAASLLASGQAAYNLIKNATIPVTEDQIISEMKKAAYTAISNEVQKIEKSVIKQVISQLFGSDPGPKMNTIKNNEKVSSKPTCGNVKTLLGKLP